MSSASCVVSAISRRSSAKAKAPNHRSPISRPNLSYFNLISSSSMTMLNSMGLVDAPCLTPFYMRICPMWLPLMARFVSFLLYISAKILTNFSGTFLTIISSMMSLWLTESKAFSMSTKTNTSWVSYYFAISCMSTKLVIIKSVLLPSVKPYYSSSN